MLPNRNSKPFSCISCGSTFKRNGDLASHLTQATKCHWVIKNREQIQAAEMPDFRELSDHEDDPPAEPELLVPYKSMDIFADDIFDEQPDERPSLDNMDQPTSSATNGSDQRVRVENVSDDEDHEFHDNDGRARIEDELDQDYIFFQDFPGAGKIYRTTGDVHQAYSEENHYQNNPFYPFASKLDWEIARWANEDGPGQSAFTRLLNIDGVRL